MIRRSPALWRLLAAMLTLVLVAAACGGDDDDDAADDGSDTTAEGGDDGGDLSGDIRVDGSSTVTPLISLAAEDFQNENSGVRVTVGTSGTGGGFEKFCNGETDISMASRAIADDEVEACEANGIEPLELAVANDGLSVVVNPANDWAECLTVEQLNTIWAPEAEGEVMSWKDVDASFPDEPLELYGAGTDSGTFDYFTEAVNGEEGATRADYTPSEDDNVTVQGVQGSASALGYFGLSYAEENADAVKIVEIDGGDGCVTPSSETVQDGTYQPLGRPLFIYVNNANYAENEALQTFVDFYLENEDAIAEEALFIDLTDEQAETARTELDSLKG